METVSMGSGTKRQLNKCIGSDVILDKKIFFLFYQVLCSAHATPGDLFDLNILNVVSYIIPLFIDCLFCTLLFPLRKRTDRQSGS